MTYYKQYDTIRPSREERRVGTMDNIEKALQELARALEDNDTVARVKIEITLTKPKPSKAKPDK